MNEIERRKNNLKEDFYNPYLDPEQIFQKHIVDTPAFIFSTTENNEEYHLRKLIAKTFKVNINKVFHWT